MKTTDSVMREQKFNDYLFKAFLQVHHGKLLPIDVIEVIQKHISHSLAEARREERERIIAILERTKGFAGMPDSTINVLGNLVFDLRNKSDLLTGDNPEEEK